MSKNGMPEGVKTTLGWAVGIAAIALVFVITLILFGNLSGNTGFAENSAGYNNTEQVIGNYSASAVNTTAQFPTVGTILGVAILLAILIAVLVFAIRKMMGITGSSGSNAGFG